MIVMKDAAYIKGAANVSQIPSDQPIFLLLGRSNVGKSSFINSLTNRKALARTSGTPGKTIVLNYYLINKAFYLVDAPGYGYARRSKSMKNEFIIMIEDILLNHPKILSILLLIDFKVGPTQDDLDIYEFLQTLDLNIIVIATKKDKIAKTRQYKREKELIQLLGKPKNFYSISNVTKDKINEIRAEILSEVEEYETSQDYN
ncbi:MAG TPA: ribosome biogenesis GTP-binding protein YihA/YsxC [Haploplasma sp.]|nr:ribosome biogenesis GTP-binding protein YihA/YsxC [Haploplasma sp.]